MSPDVKAADSLVAAKFMTQALSVYLDLVRILAAFAVLVGHLDQDGLQTRWLWIGQFSHESVVVFFVLSGLVIAHATPPGRRDWRGFAAARLARIYSVVLPAIALSFAVKGLATWLDAPQLAAEFWRDDMRWLNLVGALLFLNESWGLPASLPWNGPFWSLCYEVWYYVLFGLFVFAPHRLRWPLVGAAAVVAGPGILLLGPLWLLGAGLARSGASMQCSIFAGWVVWGASLLGMAGLHASGWDLLAQQWLNHHAPGYWRLQSSQKWATDYGWGLLMAANFVGLRAMAPSLAMLVRAMDRPVRWLASYSFSLYVFHRPFTEFIGHFWPNTVGNHWVSLGWLTLVLGLVMLLGQLTEHRKGLARDLADRILGRSALRAGSCGTGCRGIPLGQPRA